MKLAHRLWEFWKEHKWEVILGLIFAILFGIVWEAGKVFSERAELVGPDRLAAGTVRVMVIFDLKNAGDRQAAAEWKSQGHFAVITQDYAFVNMASGFVATDNGWLVTAGHVVDRAPFASLAAKMSAPPYVVAHYPSGFEGRATVKLDPDVDIAIMKVNRSPAGEYLVLGEPAKAHRLDHVLAIGYPEEGNLDNPEDPSMTSGDISKIARRYKAGRVFHTTAPISRGSSGGPLVNAESRVIAINVARPAEGSSGLAYALSVERAREMLIGQGVELPETYEHEGLWRQPAVRLAALIIALTFLVVYFGVVFRPVWTRWFVSEPADPPYAGFWVRAATWFIDLAVVVSLYLSILVLIIVVTDRYMPAYLIGLIALLPVWFLYIACCEWKWGATVGQRVGGLRVRSHQGGSLTFPAALLRCVLEVPLVPTFPLAAFDRRRRALHDRLAGTVVVAATPRSVWLMFTLASLGFLITALALVGHLRFLGDRAVDDFAHFNALLWRGSAPDDRTVARLAAKTSDRVAWGRLLPAATDHDEYLYQQGLALMLAGAPRQAIRSFEAVAGGPWEAMLQRAHGQYVEAAASKTGWCYFDLGDYVRARQMFTLFLRHDISNRDALLGLAVTNMRMGDNDGMLAACAALAGIDPDVVNVVARMRTRAPDPYDLTLPEVRAVAELQARIPKSRPPDAQPREPAVARSPAAPLR
jgi:uncharacterized RDD family membrane protein YckC